MTISIKINLVNAEVHHLFKRKTSQDKEFIKEILEKINLLLRHAKALEVHALLSLDNIEQKIAAYIDKCYDEIDKYDALLEKKKHLQNKEFIYKPEFFPTISFDNQLAGRLVELFEMQDSLISRLKTLRHAGCFQVDDDYFANLRRHFKAINCLLSSIIQCPSKTSPNLSVTDVIENTEHYQSYIKACGSIDLAKLYEVLTSSLAPRLEENLRKTVLNKLKQAMTHETIQ